MPQKARKDRQDVHLLSQGEKGAGAEAGAGNSFGHWRQ